MSGSLLRNWFVPKDGINRQVISADIQKYLGNDATVRPGKEKINGQEVCKREQTTAHGTYNSRVRVRTQLTPSDRSTATGSKHTEISLQ